MALPGAEQGTDNSGTVIHFRVSSGAAPRLKPAPAQKDRRNREQITVEQKFISGFQRGRGRQAPSPVKGRGGKGNPRLLSEAGDGDL